MKQDNIDLLLENQSLKSEFNARGLDLSQIFCEIPDDLARENRVLISLLDWVTMYDQYRDRKKMEAHGYLFPPISPGIDPENDWIRFKWWLKGKSLRKKLVNLLPTYFIPKNPENLSYHEALTALEGMSELLVEIQFSIDFIQDVPPQLKYQHLIEILEDQFDIIEEGYWHLDGCTGYCPGCFQRPWCEAGNRSCWSEDEEAGRMCLIDPIKKFVNASSQSLQILKKFNEFKK